MKIRKRFEEKITELVDVGAPNLCCNSMDGYLKACDKKMGRISKGDTWWWNEEVKEAASRKNGAHKMMCENSAEENKRKHKSMKNKAFSKTMRQNAEEVLAELQNWMLRLVKGQKTDSKEVEGGRCMRGSGGKLCFILKETGKVWKEYMDRIMHEENDWDRNVEGDAVEGPVVCVSRWEVLQALNKMKT